MTQDRASDHDVRILPGDRTIHVPAGDNVLAAALSAGINLPHSCKSGHCASCRALLLSGQIDYPHGHPVGLTPAEAAAGAVLLCQARALTDLVIEARRIRSVELAEIKTLPARIARLERLGPDVMRLSLRLPAVEPLRFQAGQYLDILLDGGRRRSFSIASPPHDADLIELHVRLSPGGGFSEWLFREAQVGALLKVEGPIGQFIYQDSERPKLLVAGGTGFAPIKSILRHVLERRLPGMPRSARHLQVFWGARTFGDLYELDLLAQWMAKHPELTVTPVLSDPPRSTSDQPESRRYLHGVVHQAVLAAGLPLADFDIYAAGPPAMIDAIRTEFPVAGALVDHLYFDSFDYAPR
ncbi:MAG TPA: FAD-binding oxidoreductase [Steroidobacteraceae bacterium]|nr:FAD-binding oxidoreductase [Steroidobacteraceae bacterium]HRX88596.1 FAD-binding oxidoreductase [Steroidobacteraceae bacterium]